MREGEPSLEAPIPQVQDLKLRQQDVTEGQQVPMSQVRVCYLCANVFAFVFVRLAGLLKHGWHTTHVPICG
jgi:hypothetical protein